MVYPHEAGRVEPAAGLFNAPTYSRPAGTAVSQAASALAGADAVGLEVRGLTVSYGSLHVLREVSFSLRPGEPLAVVGESGTGKTTLALALTGLVAGTCRGEAIFGGRNLLELTRDDWPKLRGQEIGFVPQNVEDALHPLYPALEQVAEAIAAHSGGRGRADKKAARERAGELLQLMELAPDRWYLYPHQLSGGEKQRVLLAMALANKPQLLILDEPTASLDVLTRAGIIELICRFSREYLTLVVTHDLAAAAAASLRVAVLYGGRIVEDGPTGAVLQEPRHPYTRGLVRSYPNMTTTKDLQGIPGRMTPDVGGCAFHPRCTQRLDICFSQVPLLVTTGERQLACHRGGIIPLLEVKEVDKSFSGFRVLQDVSLTLYEGETLALVGASGSGKTTLARCIMGLEVPEAGEICLESQPCPAYKGGGRSKDFYRRVQMIFQNPGETLDHRLSVLQAIQEPLEVQGTGERAFWLEKVKKVLEEVELPASEEFLARYPHQLSGGEKQRVAIARALVLEPKLLIADEPTAALDASIQAKIVRLLLNLQERRGLAILFITHDLALARKVSDRLAVMHQGRIVEEGPTAQVLAAPRHSYTRRLLAAAPDLNTPFAGPGGRW